jgi:hypothetical protein
MKAPSAHPTSTYQLRELIINDLGLRPPPDKELAVLVAVHTGMGSCNEPDAWDDSFYAKKYDKRGRLIHHTQTPPHLVLSFDAESRALGHLRPRRGTAELTHRRPKKWQDFAPEIATRFQAMYPDQNFGDRDGLLARFVAAAIQQTFPGPAPSVPAVGQLLARRRKRQ